jgi:hypothetical protein
MERLIRCGRWPRDSNVVNQPKAPSPILRWLPGRLVVARVVLGAAAGVALMYIPFVYEGKSTDWPFWTSMSPWEGRVRVFGMVVYEEKYLVPGIALEEVAWWHRGVAATFAAVGGLVGALVGWREQRRLRQRGVVARRGGWLWLPVSAGVFLLLFVAGFPGANAWSPADELRWQIHWFKQLGGWGSWWKNSSNFPGGEFALLAGIALAVGWAVHVAAGTRGVRFAVARRPDQAADYGDDVVAGEGR